VTIPGETNQPGINLSGTGLRDSHLIHSLPRGGTERVFVDLVNNLNCDEKFGVFVHEEEPNSFISQLSPEITQHCLRARLRYLTLHACRLASLLKKRRVDVLHSHSYWASLYAAVAIRMASVTVFVTTEHGHNLYKRSVHRWFERNLISASADMRICVSAHLREVRRDRGEIPASKLIVI